MILFDKVRVISLWLIGVLACISEWDPAACSKSFVFLMLLCPCLIVFFQILKNGQIKKSFFLYWYGIFFLMVLTSLLYTANHIDANDIIRRCFLCLTLGFSASQLVEDYSDLKNVMKGLVLGAFFTMAVTFIIESNRMGLGRMGSITCGAATTYAGILLIGMICLFILNQIEYHRMYVFLELILLVGIVLSGSRMPLLTVVAVFLGFKIVESESIYKMIVNVIKIVVVIVMSAYVIMTNPILYDVVGNRFETMLESFQYGTDDDTDSSLNGRHEMKVEALRLWSESPIYGQGVNSFWVLSPVHNGRASSHCGYTEILCSFGVLGFILFYWPFFKPIAKLARIKRDLTMSITVVLVVSIIMEWQGGYFDSRSHIVFWYVLFQYMRFLELEEKRY